MVINKHYQYAEIPRTEIDGVRFYDVDGAMLPSVTTILSNTTDTSFLADWRKRIGDDAADEILRQSSGTGSQMHDSLEKYILHRTPPAGNYYSRMMTNLIIKNGLSKLDEVWGCEVPLFYEGLYAGTADLVGVFCGRPAIIDFKNSRSKKELDDIGNYRCQGAAYALAHNKMFGTNIETIVIMMARHDGVYSEFDIRNEEYTESVDLWLRHVDRYYT